MARTVYIFGAGASHSMGTPLLDGFIDAADDLRRSGWPITREDFDLLFEVINQRLPSLHAKSTQDIQNLETVFNLIEMGELLGRFPQTKPDDIQQLSRAIRTVLSETIEFTSRFSYSFSERSWSPPPGYAHVIADCFPGGDRVVEPNTFAFLTFNYDIGLDFALAERGINVDYALGLERANTVPLLKLHGSLNWCATSGPEDISALPIPAILERNGYPKNTGAAKILLPLRIKPFFGLLHPAITDPAPSATLVPPTWNKTQFHRTFRRIWQRAAKELSDASEIIVVGYSYPPADEFFHALIALGLAGSSRLRRFLVVDPGQKVGGRFQELLGPDTKGRFQHRPITFEQFYASGEHQQLRLRPIGAPA